MSLESASLGAQAAQLRRETTALVSQVRQLQQRPANSAQNDLPGRFLIADMGIRAQQLTKTIDLLEENYSSQTSSNKDAGLDLQRVITLVSALSRQNARDLDALRLEVSRKATANTQAKSSHQMLSSVGAAVAAAAPPPVAEPVVALAPAATQPKLPTTYQTPTKQPKSLDESFDGPRTPSMADFNITASKLALYANMNQKSKDPPAQKPAPSKPISSPGPLSYAAVAASPSKPSATPSLKTVPKPARSSPQPQGAVQQTPHITQTQQKTSSLLITPTTAPKPTLSAAPLLQQPPKVLTATPSSITTAPTLFSTMPTKPQLAQPATPAEVAPPSTASTLSSTTASLLKIKPLVASNLLSASTKTTTVTPPQAQTQAQAVPTPAVAPEQVPTPVEPSATKFATATRTTQLAPAVAPQRSSKESASTRQHSGGSQKEQAPIAALANNVDSRRRGRGAAAAPEEPSEEEKHDTIVLLMDSVSPEEKSKVKPFLWSAIDLLELNQCIDKINEFVTTQCLDNFLMCDFITEREFVQYSRFDDRKAKAALMLLCTLKRLKMTKNNDMTVYKITPGTLS